MSALFGLSLNLLGFALLGITQAKQRQQAQNYFGGTTAHCLRITGYLMVSAGAAYLIGISPGGLGIVIWFGWHPLMIIGVALMAGLQFSGLLSLIALSALLVTFLSLILLIG